MFFKKNIKVCHIITSLEVGGAQTLLLEICRGLAKGEIRHFVISISNNIVLKSRFESIGCHVYTLNINTIMFFPTGLQRLIRILNEERPNIIHTWLYHSDFISIFTSLVFKKVKVIWSIHHASASSSYMRYSTWLLIRVLALVSYIFPEKIVYCSPFALQIHHSIGYSKGRSLLIPNGIDVNKFFPQRLVRKEFKRTLSISEDSVLVGMVARFSSIKGFDVFLKMLFPPH